MLHVFLVDLWRVWLLSQKCLDDNDIASYPRIYAVITALFSVMPQKIIIIKVMALFCS